MTEFKQTSTGAFETQGLSEREFSKVFKKIETLQRRARRNAKKTLTPSILRQRNNEQLKSLGDKVAGQGFTVDDLKAFDKNRKRHAAKFDSKTAGITYKQLIALSRSIDVKRANNKVDDDTGLTFANLHAVKHNVILVNVRASAASKHQHHLVKIRCETWDDLLVEPPDNDYVKAVAACVQDRISFDCDCGRHQYWYRYLATVGNYALSPPKEFSFPKLKNPQLSGVACKHVIKSIGMLQSIAWHRVIAKRMEEQAKKIGYGDDVRHTMIYLSDKEKKDAAKNRKTQVDHDKVKRAYQRYQKSLKGMQNKVRTSPKKESQKLSRKIKTQSNQIDQLKDMLKFGFASFADGYKMQGKTRAHAITDYAKQFNVSPKELERILK